MFFIVAAVGCNAPSNPDIRFELRGLKIEATETEYSTSYKFLGTVIAHGDSTVASRPYSVLYKVHRISGGDPSTARATNDDFVGVMVVNGSGDYADYAGSRRKATSYQSAETWEPEKVEVTSVAYSPWVAIPPAKK